MFAELSFAYTLDGGRAHSVALSEAVLTSRQTRALAVTVTTTR